MSTTVANSTPVKRTVKRTKKETVKKLDPIVEEVKTEEQQQPVVKEEPQVHQETSPERTEEPQTEEPQTEEEKLSKKKKNYNTLVNEIDHLLSIISKFQENHKDEKNTKLNKFIKDLNKSATKIKNNAGKIGKQKNQPSALAGTSNSGFKKPVRISQEVADFTGWSVDEPRSRIDVTNFICNYIGQNKLQKPGDGRVILADERLSNLLQYDSEKHGPLTYASIQKFLAKHYQPYTVQNEEHNNPII